MKTHKEALTLALEMVQNKMYAHAEMYLKEALAQPEQEPVGEAYLCDRCQTPFDGAYECPSCGHNEATKEPVYTTPPQRKPLTDEELRVIENKINPTMRWRSSDEEGITLYPQEYYELVRAIEAAHGIKE